jgi:hypothetical protein
VIEDCSYQGIQYQIQVALMGFCGIMVVIVVLVVVAVRNQRGKNARGDIT